MDGKLAQCAFCGCWCNSGALQETETGDRVCPECLEATDGGRESKILAMLAAS